MTAKKAPSKTFGTTAQRLVDNGYRPTPVDGKRAILDDWPRREFQASDAQRYAASSTGIVCGGVIGADIDVRDARLAAQIEAVAVETLGAAPRRIGNAPKVLLMYRSAKPFEKIPGQRWILPGDDAKAPGYKPHKVEILADGQQFVAYGIHPDTRQPYRWNGVGDPLTVPLADLPVITEVQAREFVKTADAILARVGKPHGRSLKVDFDAARPAKLKSQLVASNFADLLDALAAIPNGVDYDSWIKIGHAFHTACGEHADSDTAREAWISWSLTWPQNKRSDAIKKWKSFKDDRPTAQLAGAGTVFKLAKEAGWTPAWPHPVDFLHEVAAPGFTGDDVPDVIADYAIAWGRAAGFDPTAFIAAGVATMAAALSDSIQLEVQATTRWRESARLWSAVIAQPGQAKTPMIKAAVLPLQEIHRELVEGHTPGDDEGERVPRPATFTSDSTIEALSNILADNPRGVMYLAHELDSWIGGHDAYRNGGGSPDRGQWLELFDGGPHQVDRIKRGSFYVPNWGVSLMSATTPTALMKLRNKLPNDGLLQRVLVFFTKEPTPPEPEWPTQEAGQEYARVIRAVHAFNDNLPLVEFSREGRRAFQVENDRYRMLAPACASISEGFAGHVSKYGAFLARVTLTFHAAECGVRNRHPTQVPVSVATVETAKRFMSKCFLHSRALYDMLSGSDSAMQLARDVGAALVADRYAGVSRRDLVQRLKSFRDAERQMQQEAMQLLCDFDWCRVEDGKYDKGYATTWSVNPAVQGNR